MFNLLWKNVKEIFHNKKIVIATIIIALAVIIGLPFIISCEKDSTDTPFVKLGVIDMENNIYSNMLLSYFIDNEYFNGYVEIITGDVGTVVSAFENRELDAYVEIPEGFIENLIYVENMPLKIRINGDNTMVAVILKNVLESYEKYISSVEVSIMSLYDIMQKNKMNEKLITDKNIEMSYSLVMTALGRDKLFSKDETADFPSTTLSNYYIFAFISVFLMYLGLSTGLDMLRENKNKTLQRYLIINRRIFKFIISKIMAVSFYVLILSGSIYGIAVAVGKLKLNIFLILNYIIFTVFFVTLGVFVSSFFCNRNMYMLTGNMLYFMLIIIGGGLIPIMYLPQNIVNIAYITPNYWFIRSMLLLQKNFTGSQPKLVMIIVFTAIVLMSLLLSFIYSRKEAVHE